MRKVLIFLVLVAVLVTGGLWVYQNWVAQASQPAEEREEFTIRRGTLVAQVNTTGTVLPKRQTNLSFAGTGRIAQVWVKEGQAVKAGDPLAQLEATELEGSVAEAELALALAQTQLLRLQRPPTDYELAAARAALSSAQASYDRLLAGPTEEEVRIARSNLDQAEAALKQAQATYDHVKDRPDVAMLPQSLQLEQATISYETAKANFDLTQRKPSTAELAAARSSIVQAEANLARLQEGVTEEDLLIAQLQVEQAQARLDQARRLADVTLLTAPHDGTITRVGAKVGEMAGLQALPAFVLTDLSEYHVEATIDEIDIGRVEVGQPVTITLDALPGEVLSGHISEIAQTADTAESALQGQTSTGVVSFKVVIALEPTSAPIRVGMTANVDIITERREEILLVPNRFVRIDRTSGRTYVDRLQGDQVQPVEIQIGLRDELSSEVLAGLEEGDKVVLVQQSTREQLRQMFGPPG